MFCDVVCVCIGFTGLRYCVLCCVVCVDRL